LINCSWNKMKSRKNLQKNYYCLLQNSMWNTICNFFKFSFRDDSKKFIVCILFCYQSQYRYFSIQLTANRFQFENLIRILNMKYETKLCNFHNWSLEYFKMLKIKELYNVENTPFSCIQYTRCLSLNSSMTHTFEWLSPRNSCISQVTHISPLKFYHSSFVT